uniref:Uncharacterized protein n=1 Tax=Glossina austeni TaxID=7395 RepID=A0A1A9VVA2_GLOAU
MDVQFTPDGEKKAIYSIFSELNARAICSAKSALHLVSYTSHASTRKPASCNFKFNALAYFLRAVTCSTTDDRWIVGRKNMNPSLEHQEGIQGECSILQPDILANQSGGCLQKAIYISIDKVPSNYQPA